MLRTRLAGLRVVGLIVVAHAIHAADVPLVVENGSFEKWAPREKVDPLWELHDRQFPVGWTPESYKGVRSGARVLLNQRYDVARCGRYAMYLRGQVVSSSIYKPLGTLVSKTLLVSVRARGQGGHLRVALRAYHYPPTERFLYMADLLEIDTTPEWQTYSSVVFVSYGSGMRSVRVVLEADGVFVDDVRVTVVGKPTQADPVRMTIPVVAPDRAPKVDGVFGPQEWDAATAVTGFANIMTRTLASRQGRAGLLTDGDRLFVCTRWPAVRRPRANVEKRDGDVWTDDAVEVFIGPWPGPGQQPDVYQFIVNAKAVVFDQRIRPYVGQAESAWNSSAQVRSTVADRWWTLEMAIPLKEVGVTPGKPFGLQLCRDFTAPGEYTSLTGGPYRKLFRCEPSATAPRVSWTYVGDLRTGSIDVHLSVLNTTGQPVGGEARVTAAGATQHTAAKRFRLPPGRSETVVLPMSGRPTPYGRFAIEVGPAQGKPGFRQQFVLNTGHFGARVGARLANPRIEFYPVQKKLNLRACNVPEDRRALYHEARFRIDCGKRVVTSVRVSPAVWADQEAHFTLPFDPPDDRPYRVHAVVCDPKGNAVELVTTTVREQPTPWLGNKLGLDPIVVPPFTPVRVKDRTVSCWGRDHRLGGTGMPDAIAVHGRALLAGPVRLVAIDPSGTVHQAKGSLRVTPHGGHHVQIDSQGTLGDLGVRLTGSMLYDGLFQYELHLTPRKPVPLKRLSLDVPLGVAKYLHCVRDSMRQNSEWIAVPQGQGRIWDSAKLRSRRVFGTFAPVLWVGDERAGLAWFADNDRGWITDADSPCLELVRQGKTVTMRVNFVSHPSTVSKGCVLRFGLVATPVKPTPVAPQHKFVINYFGFDQPVVNAYSQGMISKDPHLARQILAPRRRAGQSAHVYMANEEMPVADPVSRYMYYEWAHSSFHFYRGGLGAMRRRFFGPDPEHYMAFQNCATPSRLDYNLHCFDKLLDMGLSGLYMDNSYPYSCANTQHPHCGYVRGDGQLQAGYNLANTRDLIRRVAVRAYQKKGIWPRVSIHMTGAMVIPCFSFADLCIDGEDRSQMSMDKDFMDFWPLERVAIMGAVAWGPMRGWLPKIHFAEGTKQDRPTRTMLAELKLFDMWIWPAHCNTRVLKRILDIEKACGLGKGDVRFLGYWESADHVTTGHKDVRSSFYVRPGQVALVYVSNFARKDVDVRLRLDLGRFGLARANVVDAETGKALTSTGGVCPITIPWHDFRLLKLTPVK